VEATAPGHQPWQGQAGIDGVGAQTTLEVPPLAEAPAEPATTAPTAAPTAPTAPPSPPPEPAPPAAPHGSAQRSVGLLIEAAGWAGLIVGTTFGAIARSDNDDAKKNCLVDSACTPQGVASTTSAQHAATASTVAFIAGGALVVAGLVVYLTAPPNASRPASRLGLSPMVGAGTGGIALNGGW
jgi:hypothetical protein